jgi:DNA replication protein DnaC
VGDLRGSLPGSLHVPDSQLPVSRWHEQIGDPTLADGIHDRLVHNAHRIEMGGDSMRKDRETPNV